MKTLKTILFTMVMAIFGGMAIASGTGLPVLPVIGGLTITSLIPSGESGIAFVGVYREVWTGEMIKRFTHTATFLEKVPDYSRYVGNDVIHLVDVGAHPSVLINNTTYPLTPQSLGNDDIGISLSKFETEPISITNDELYAISYNKIKAAHDLHREALQMGTADKAAHAFAPASDSSVTPIVKTSGGDNGNGFKRLLIADIIRLKKKFDDMKAPKNGRTLVLGNQHIADLLSISESFQNQYQNIAEGKVLKLYGFEVHEYINTPLYDGAFVKKAYAAVAAGTDRESSFAFVNSRMFKAKGTIEAFLQEAKDDVLNKRNLSSFDLRFIALPKKNEAIAAIVSDTVV
ncbi:MAG: hypothetical protein JXA16_01005 [Bacteroidales bacterium]|nr:hypothetical protein [Bacteroidales bacterium]